MDLADLPMAASVLCLRAGQRPPWLPLLLALAAGCRGEPPDYRLEAESLPLSYRVIAGERVVVAGTENAFTSSLFFETAAGLQHLEQPIRFELRPTSLEAEYRTSDGRRALVRIEPQGHGGPRISVAFTPIEGVLRVGERLRARPDEALVGLSERTVGNDDFLMRDTSVVPSLDRRGHVVEMDVSGTISKYSPFYISSAGYGLFVEGTWTGRFDMSAGHAGEIRFVFDGPGLTYHIFLGDPPDVVEAYASVVGPPFVPPRWALGHWRWRDDHVHADTLFDGLAYRGPFNSQVYEDVMMLEALEIPLQVYWVDRPWAVGSFGYDDLEWDRSRLPHPEAMIDWLAERDVRFLLWIAPWVMGEMATEAVERAYFLPTVHLVDIGLGRADQAFDTAYLESLRPELAAAITELGPWHAAMAGQALLGQPVDPDDPAEVTRIRAELLGLLERARRPEELRRLLIVPTGGRALIDFTNPEAVAWWQRHLDRRIADGVAGFKLDRADEIVPSARDVYAHDGRSMAEAHNDYVVRYAEAAAAALRRRRGDDYAMILRAGYPAARRHSLFWGGDSHNTWPGLRNAVIGAQRAATMGYVFWGSDTGGYHPPTDRELLARWLAFSAFCPIMEVGPTSNRAPWSMAGDPSYDVELIAIWRLYARLHERLRDYTYRHALEAGRTGRPIIRPLFYAFPDDPVAWRIWDEYLYGDDYLVAPVLVAGATARDIYLPEGTWIDYWEPAEAYRGPVTVTVPAPLHRMPIFLRGSSPEPVIDLEALYRQSVAMAEGRPRPPDGSELSGVVAGNTAASSPSQ